MPLKLSCPIINGFVEVSKVTRNPFYNDQMPLKLGHLIINGFVEVSKVTRNSYYNNQVPLKLGHLIINGFVESVDSYDYPISKFMLDHSIEQMTKQRHKFGKRPFDVGNVTINSIPIF